MLLHLREFEYMAAGVFILSLVNDMLRPANASSIAYYSNPENVTRAFSLNRMAINLGFSIGPALGGLLAALSYKWLFIADGTTCILAGMFFFLYFRAQQGHRPVKQQKEAKLNVSSPYHDKWFILFGVLCAFFAIIFFQLFATLPLYYRQVHALSESNIGLLMALNGLIVFMLEMIVVYLLGEKAPKALLVAGGLLLLGLSYILLVLSPQVSILFASMLLLSLSEILAMPFMSTITVERSDINNRGAYMGLYTISYAAAHVVSPYLGTSIIVAHGFDTLWWACGGLSVITAIGFYFVIQQMEKQRYTKLATLTTN